MNKVKAEVGLVFVAVMLLELAGQSSAYPPLLNKARKFGAKDCTFCHVEPDGGPPWNERGKWLVAEKERRKAEVVDVEWLVNYKPASSAGKNVDSKNAREQAGPARSVEQELTVLFNELVDAAKTRDASVFARTLADDFSEIDADGQVFKKSDILTAVSSFVIESYTVSEVTTRVLGDSAVVTFHQTSKGTVQGLNIGGEFRETLVWAKRDGRWQIVAAHVSRISAQTTGGATDQKAPAGKPDPKSYDAYAGEYELPIFTLAVTREGDKLFGQPAGDTREEFVPVSESEFSVTNVNAKVRFVKDDKGKVTHMVVNLNGQEIQGKKVR